MPRIATRHAHKLAYRQRFSLGVRMLGCLVMLAGAMVLAAALAEVVKGSPLKSVWLMFSLGCLLVACGAILFCGERGKLIDREARTLTCWRGAVWPLFRRQHDLHAYNAIGVQSRDQAGLRRWCVVLWNGQGELLELFDLASEETARVAARQVAKFLSLVIAQPPATPVPASASSSSPEPSATSVPPTEYVTEAGSEDLWTYRQRFSRPVRLLGVILLSLASMMLVGVAIAATAEGGRGLAGLAIVAAFLVLGWWFLAGGRRVEIDVVGQAIAAWRAWPLPPARYDIASFRAVIVAPATTIDAPEQRPVTYLVGLVGADQLRLEVVAAAPREEALAIAGQIAALMKLPLMNESQPPVSNSPQGVVS